MKIDARATIERLLLGGLAVLPLIFIRGIEFPFSVPRSALFFLLIWILTVVVAWRPQGVSALWQAARQPISVALAVVVLIFTMSALFGASWQVSVFGSVSRIDGLILWWHLWLAFTVLRVIFSEQKNQSFFFVMFVTAAGLVSVIAILEKWSPGLRAWLFDASGRSASTIGNPLFLASYLTVSGGIALWRLALEKRRWFFYLTTIALMLAAIFLSGSRGPMLGMVAGVLAVFFYAALALRGQRRFLAAAVFVLLVVSAVWFGGRAVSSGRETGVTRLIIWQVALRSIPEHPVLGWGFGLFDRAFDKNYDPRLLEFSAFEVQQDKPHNVYLQYAVETGAIGLIAYLIFLIVSAAQILRTPWTREARAAAFFTLTVFAVQGFTAFDTLSSLAPMVFLLAAVPFRRADADVSRPATVSSEVAGRGHIESATDVVKKYAITVISVAAAAIVVIMSGRLLTILAHPADYESRAAYRGPYAADLHWTAGNRIIQALNGGQNMPMRVFDQTMAALSYDYERDPTASRLPNMIGQILLAAGASGDRQKIDGPVFAAAEIFLNTALKLSPKRQTYAFTLAQAYLEQANDPRLGSEKINAALDLLRQTRDLDPNAADGHWFYGLALDIAGKRPEVKIEIQRAIELGHPAVTPEAAAFVKEILETK